MDYLRIREDMVENHKNKIIELDKIYFTTEWSWNPICDRRKVYKEIIREHANINGMDCYFTNKNNRVYFKEDLYENETEAKEIVNWQNSYGYDYETKISREFEVMKYITFENYHWVYKHI